MFGESYSGLEYDYRGLCHVYEELQEFDKYLEYQSTLDTWKLLREGREEENVRKIISFGNYLLIFYTLPPSHLL